MQEDGGTNFGLYGLYECVQEKICVAFGKKGASSGKATMSSSSPGHLFLPSIPLKHTLPLAVLANQRTARSTEPDPATGLLPQAASLCPKALALLGFVNCRKRNSWAHMDLVHHVKIPRFSISDFQKLESRSSRLHNHAGRLRTSSSPTNQRILMREGLQFLAKPASCFR